MATKKILLVDDDKIFISAIAAMLTAKGYETKVAHSADEGFETAVSFDPDLFILDVNMETFNAGFDLAKRLRVSEPFKTTPAIMLTGIDTMAASAQIVEMYNEMEGMPGFESNKVLKIQNADGTVSVDYKTDSGQKYFLMLDGFIGKPVDSDRLLAEIGRFLKD
jgi:CheY-like chemotaxis protein